MAGIKDSHLVLSKIGLEFAGHTKNLYIWPGRIKLRDWYNHKTGRNVHIRTIDNYISRLVKEGHWERTARTKDLGSKGKQFTSSLTKFLGPGLKALQKFGVEAFAIINRIKSALKIGKKESPPKEIEGDRDDSLTPLGENISEVMNKYKPS